MASPPEEAEAAAAAATGKDEGDECGNIVEEVPGSWMVGSFTTIAIIGSA